MAEVLLHSAVEDYLAHLTVERGLAVNTLAAYRRDLGRYVAHLDAAGRTRPDDITERDVEDFVAVMRTGADGGAPLSASSTARAVVALRGWHRFCALEGLTGTDAARSVRPPTQPKRLPKAISTSDVERLLEAASVGEGPVPLRDRALLELLYSTGARISEAVGLDVDDLDLTHGRASVRLRGKGRKERVVPVGSYAVDAVDAYLVRARPGPGDTGGVPQHPWRAAEPAERVGAAERGRGAGPPGRCGARLAAHAAALVRDAPARGRCRRPRRPGAARSRLGHDHADLHPGDA